LAISSTYKRLVAVAAVIIVGALYLTGLTRMGMFSTDEPRYAAIARSMAASGDWVTPMLWGNPWFEKPVLLYWMTGAGFQLGLGPDLAPRLPVALLSVAFLIFFWKRLSRVFTPDVAAFATAILGTSAGWLAYSHVAVTDLPLAAFFSAAVLCSLPAKNEEPLRQAAAVFLGLAVLAKSLPPLVLFLPVLVLDYRNWRRWLLSWPLAAFLLVALPWHILGFLRNGTHFLYVLFVEQQLSRFHTDALQHVQPWWFYGPVLLLFLYPWFPLIPLVVNKLGTDVEIRNDHSIRVLAAVTVWGFVFFSASVNKLPGYVLPLVPATCILLGIALAGTARRERWLIAPIGLLGALPLAASVVPESVAHGLRAAQIPWMIGVAGLAVLLVIGGVFAVWQPTRTFWAAVFLASAGFFQLEMDLFPALDRVGSARPLWSASHPECAPILPRGMLYGLYYYSEKALPDCAIVDKNATPLNGSKQTK
jgi:4-amino-4-deoxy-L-arabinose transferase-like glycosyltransferase